MTGAAALEHHLMRLFEQRGALLDADGHTCQERIERDYQLATSIEQGSPILRVWRNPNCLVGTRRLQTNKLFRSAMRESEARGWPVAIRRSGGTIVVHRPGVLNVSYIDRICSGTGQSEPAGYDLLLERLSSVLNEVGIDTHRDSVPGAYCDGRQNLCWRGRKIAGTAAFHTPVNGELIRVTHAALVVWGSVEADIDAINQLEAALGQPSGYDPKCHTTVAEAFNAMQRDGGGEELGRALEFS